MRTLGIIGLGLLGTALAHRLLRAGHAVIGYDLSPAAREALITAGGRATNSAAAVASACEVLLLSLPDSNVVTGVIAEIEPALKPGLLIIDTTTGDPRAAAVTGAELAARGVRYLDAAIAGSSAQVHEGQATIMAGGDAESLAAVHDILGTFAAEVFHVGPSGSGSRMKLVVNLVLGLNRAVLAEGITLARALELDPRRALDVLRSSAAYSQVMDTKGPKMLTEDFAPQARLSQHLKDVRLILEAAERTGVELPLSLEHRALLERAEQAGFGQLDNSAIIRAYRGANDPS